MNKIFKLMLILPFFLFVLASCSSDSETNNNAKIELDFWTLFGGGDLSFMEEIVEEFNNSQDEIVVNMPAIRNSDYYTKLVTSVAANRGPDVAIAHTSKIPELNSRGLTEPIDDFAEEVGLDFNEFTKNLVEGTNLNGKHYGVPIDTHPFIMYVNNDLAAQAGVLDENGNIIMEETPEGYIDFLLKIKKALPDKIPLAISNAGADPFRMWWAFYFQMGGSPIYSGDLSSPDVTIDREIAIKAANYVRSLFHEHEIVPLNLADFYQDFQTGRAVTMTTGVWATGIWETTEGLDFTALPLPNLFEQKATWGDSHTLIMPIKENTTREKQLAVVKFMDFVTDRGVDWAEAGHIPAKKSVVESQEFQDLPYRSDYAKVAEYVALPNKTAYGDMSKRVFEQNLDLAWTNRESTEKVIDTLIKDLENLVKK
ncbi:extracellular solute-binding protein [Gracilibacillus dipsosauri]|nr:extracellular solute-binding protein [Gracilibacillus dipsosauri]